MAYFGVSDPDSLNSIFIGVDIWNEMWLFRTRFCRSNRTLLQDIRLSWVESGVCVSVCAQSCPTLCDPMDCSPSGSSVHEISPGKREYWSGLPLPSPRDCPHLGTEVAFPTLAGEFLTNEPPGKPQQSINPKGQIKIFSGIQVMMEASKSTFLNYKLGRQPH